MPDVPKGSPAMARDGRAGLRLWIFRITALVAFPALLLAGGEAGLRLAGVGHPAGFTLECDADGRDAFCENNRFTWRFFPPQIARTPLPFAVPAAKPEGTVRIFILGGSAAQGDPEPAYGFSRILGAMLRERHPGTEFEIVNTAVTAINSHVVLPIARDVARRSPDLFIVYLGNNEVVGPYGAGTVFAPVSPSLALIRAGIFLRGMRAGQVLERLLQPGGGSEGTAEWRGMEMFLERQVPVDAPGLQSVYAHFEDNLGDIIEVARGAGAPIIVSTVGVNLKDSAPFASQHRPDLSAEEEGEWERLYRAGSELEAAGRHREAIAVFRKALGLDGRFAALHFRLGRSLLALGDEETARSHFSEARDLDALRFRADSRVNETIRVLAGDRETEGVFLHDAAAGFAAGSPDGIPGEELFFEHVHMTFHGNYLLARGLLPQVERALQRRVGEAVSERPLPVEEEVERMLAYTGADRRKVSAEVLRRLGQPPFTNQINHAEQKALWEERGAALDSFLQPAALEKAAALYREALGPRGNDPVLLFRYGLLLEKMGRPDLASVQFRSVVQILPNYFEAREKLAAALVQMGRLEEGVAQCREALRLMPHFDQAYYTMAFALASLGRFEESLVAYEELLRLDPASTVRIGNEMGRILVRQGRYATAAEIYNRAVAYNAAHRDRPIPDLRFNLAYVYRKLGRDVAAGTELRAAAESYRRKLDDAPESSVLHMALGRTLAAQGDPAGAISHYRRAAQLAPGELGNHLALIGALKDDGRAAEAVEAAWLGVGALEREGRFREVAELRSYLRRLEAGTGR